MLRRLLVAIIASVIAWLGLAQPADAVVSASASHLVECNYGEVHHPVVRTGAISERGPPKDPRTQYVDDGTAGSSARPLGTSTCFTCAYDVSRRFVHLVIGTGTTSEPAQVSNGGFSAFECRQVAAKSADDAIRGVDDVLGGLSKGRSSGVRTVGSNAELDDVYGALTRGGSPYDVPGYKGTWIERSDGVRVGLRVASKSGGRTIDIRYPDGTTGKIHIE